MSVLFALNFSFFFKFLQIFFCFQVICSKHGFLTVRLEVSLRIFVFFLGGFGGTGLVTFGVFCWGLCLLSSRFLDCCTSALETWLPLLFGFLR